GGACGVGGPADGGGTAVAIADRTAALSGYAQPTLGLTNCRPAPHPHSSAAARRPTTNKEIGSGSVNACTVTAKTAAEQKPINVWKVTRTLRCCERPLRTHTSTMPGHATAPKRMSDHRDACHGPGGGAGLGRR